MDGAQAGENAVRLTAELVGIDSINPTLVPGAPGVPALVFGPAGGSLHAIDEWVDLNQVRRYPVALSGALTRLLT